MNSSIKAIVFDYGNVLLDWDARRIFEPFFPGGTKDIEAFFAEVGFMDWHRQQDAGRPFPEAIAELSARFPKYAHMLPDYDTRYADSISGPILGTVEILRRLKQRGTPLYGLSNYPAEKFRLDRPKYEFFEWFDDMVISGEVRLSKPDPAIFHLLLNKIGRAAQECLFIDDSLANITTARALGFTAIQFHSAGQLEHDLHALGLL